MFFSSEIKQVYSDFVDRRRLLKARADLYRRLHFLQGRAVQNRWISKTNPHSERYVLDDLNSSKPEVQETRLPSPVKRIQIYIREVRNMIGRVEDVLRKRWSQKYQTKDLPDVYFLHEHPPYYFSEDEHGLMEINFIVDEAITDTLNKVLLITRRK